MSHEVFVGITEEVVACGAVGAEVEIAEDGDECGESVLLLFAVAEFAAVVEIRLVNDSDKIFVSLGEFADDFVDFLTDVFVASEVFHGVETTIFWYDDDGVGVVVRFVGDVFHEEEREDVVFVLGCVHAAAEFVAALPERCVELRFFQCHVWFLFCGVGFGLRRVHKLTVCATREGYATRGFGLWKGQVMLSPIFGGAR